MKKMISVVLNTLNNDSRVLKIGKTIKKNGIEINFCAISTQYTKYLPYFYNIIDNTDTLRMTWNIRQTISYSNKDNGIKTITPFNFFIQLKSNIQRTAKLFKVLMLKRYDIYYCNDFNTLISGYFASKRKRAKLIYDSHELWSERNGSRSTTFNRINRLIEYFIEWFLIKRCNLVITVSNGIANELVKRYKINKPIVIKNLDEEKPLPSFENRMRIRDKLNIPHNCILIVYQGSLHKNRGIPELVKAMDTLPQHIHLLLMGKFISKKELIEVKSNPRIHFPGMIPQKDLFNYTACADIGIAPIRINMILSYRLAFPNKFSQYMNAGLALALYSIPESRIIIEKYDCGIVFEPGSSENIVNAINNIISSGKLEYYKKESRKGFLKEYNWEIEKHKLLQIIK